MKIHFSVDDTINSFRWITKNSDSVHSIFESRVFSFAKYIYEMTGINTSFYCIYEQQDFCLRDVSTKWKQEFELNSDWLKLGFHCVDGKDNYKTATYDDGIAMYQKVANELIRIAGSGSITYKIRTHYFSGSYEFCRALSDMGIRCLLCADDKRGSYYLSESNEKKMKKRGYVVDSSFDMRFEPTHIRIEKLDSNWRSNLNDNNGRVNIFTHERFLDDRDTASRLIKIVRYIQHL